MSRLTTVPGATLVPAFRDWEITVPLAYREVVL
jgi:hypothetical protein